MELNELHIAERSAEKPAEPNSSSVKAIFGMLYDILALYEASGCYNYIPDTENSDGGEYFEGLIKNIRKKLTADFPGKRDDTVNKKLDRIIGETESFVKSYEVPGVVMRWREINPQINYFDCVFDLIDELGMETARELYREGRLEFFPSERDIEARKDYFAQKEPANTEERVFQDELLRTLTMVFENDFGGNFMAYDSIEKLLKYKERAWEYNFEYETNNEEYKKLKPLDRYISYKASGAKQKEYDYKNAEAFIIFCHDKYNDVYDPDGSGYDSYPIVHEIYNKLWNWEKGNNTTFGKIDGVSFNEETDKTSCLFGADTMNSVQNVLAIFISGLEDHQKAKLVTPNSKKEAISYLVECFRGKNKEAFKDALNNKPLIKPYLENYHTLGNFVLVPAYFNKKRTGYTSDFWDSSLAWLKNSGFIAMQVKIPSEKYPNIHICYRDEHNNIIIADKVNAKEYIDDKKTVNFFEFDKKYFSKYINYFFLWDYVEVKNGEYIINPLFGSNKRKVEKSTIRDSSYWTSPKNESEANEFIENAIRLIERRGKFMTAMLRIKNDEQSDLYARIQENLFAKNDELFSGIDKAAEEILKRFESEIPGNAKRLLDELKKGVV